MSFDDDFLRDTISKAGGFRPAARLLNEQGIALSETSLRRRFGRITDVLPFEVEMPEEEVAVDFDALFERRKQDYERKLAARQAQRIIPVGVRIDGPFGIGFMGDPHVDDDGTDIEELFRHVDLFDGRHEGLFAGCLGDVWNNWTGRLSHLWSEQSVSAEEARVLVREFLQRIRWLFFVYGNHDAWGGKTDLLEALLSSHSAINKGWRVRVGLKLPNGRNVKILAAHGFQGKNQWSQVFGASKAAQLDGTNHIYVGGHTHVSGYTHGWHDGNEVMWHAVQVASYKKIDRYADELGLADHHIYNCPVALIDPNATKQMNFVRFEFDPDEAADRLKWMRSRWKAAKSC